MRGALSGADHTPQGALAQAVAAVEVADAVVAVVGGSGRWRAAGRGVSGAATPAPSPEEAPGPTGEVLRGRQQEALVPGAVPAVEQQGGRPKDGCVARKPLRSRPRPRNPRVVRYPAVARRLRSRTTATMSQTDGADTTHRVPGRDTATSSVPPQASRRRRRSASPPPPEGRAGRPSGAEEGAEGSAEGSAERVVTHANTLPLADHRVSLDHDCPSHRPSHSKVLVPHLATSPSCWPGVSTKQTRRRHGKRATRPRTGSSPSCAAGPDLSEPRGHDLRAPEGDMRSPRAQSARAALPPKRVPGIS